MTIQTEFEARYSAAHRVRISNPDDQSATTQNDTLVAQACTDAEARFGVVVQAAYDSANVVHVQLMAKLVHLALLEYGAVSASAVQAERDATDKLVEALRNYYARNRLTPATSSQYQHSTKSSVVRPEFDDEEFNDIIVRSPSRAETNPDA